MWHCRLFDDTNVSPSQLEASNAPTDGYAYTYDADAATGVWAPAAGSGDVAADQVTFTPGDDLPETITDLQLLGDYLAAGEHNVVYVGASGAAYTTLNAALAAIAASVTHTNPYLIKLAPGTYSAAAGEDATTTIPDGVSIEGAGYGATTISVTLAFTGTHDASFRGCKITTASMQALVSNVYIHSDIVEEGPGASMFWSTYDMTADTPTDDPVKFATFIISGEIHSNTGAGNVSADIWVAASDTTPVSTDTIVGSNHPALSSAKKATWTTSGWSSAYIAPGSRISFSVEASPAATVSDVAIVAYCRKAKVVP